MKIFFLLLSIFLSGCVNNAIQLSSRERNPKCEDIDEIEVFQVFDDGALAFVCERKSYDDCVWGMTVAVPKRRNEILYDKKRIKAPKGKCFVYDGTYQYKNKDNDTKTVPIIGYAYEYEASSEEEFTERLLDFHNHIYEGCMDELDNKKSQTANKKQCECFADSVMEIMFDNAKSDKKSQSSEEIVAAAEKKCGKIMTK